MTVLVVDDERPALDELAWLLRQDERIGQIRTCSSATEVLQQVDGVDAVFLDISMPQLTGVELAGILGRFKNPPQLVFVTAHEGHAVDAFDLRAVDYVLKPVRPERLRDTVTRLVGTGRATAASDVQIPVELGGVTRFIRRSDITHVEAHGDYARLHTGSATHLVRTPLTQLEAEWDGAGFVRVHRSILVNLAKVTEIRTDAGRCVLLVGEGTELQVARRHTRAVKDRLATRA